jgi:hypothetical protein
MLRSTLVAGGGVNRAAIVLVLARDMAVLARCICLDGCMARNGTNTMQGGTARAVRAARS